MTFSRLVLAGIVKGVDWFSKFMNFLCNRHNFIKMIDIKIKIYSFQNGVQNYIG